MRGWLWIMNWEGCARKRSWPDLWNYLGIFLRWLRGNPEKPWYNRCPGRDSNLAHPKYKSETLALSQLARLWRNILICGNKILDTVKRGSSSLHAQAYKNSSDHDELHRTGSFLRSWLSWSMKFSAFYGTQKDLYRLHKNPPPSVALEWVRLLVS